MKDLLVYVADADALAFLRAILQRHQALGIRPVTFDIERHPQRDAGMVQSGAELVRMKKGRYHKALLMWDHHGSGRDHRQAPNLVAQDIQGKLDSFTWSGNSSVTVLVPELEQWLWFCENAVAAHCGITQAQLDQWVQERSLKLGKTADAMKQQQPKELFEHIMRERIKRTISPRDFDEIGQRASVNALLACGSFNSIALTLQTWFPL
jgi:hypothetical protein